MNKTALAAAALAVAGAVAIPAPAHAGISDYVKHFAPDEGYDNPITYADRYGRVYSIGEGSAVNNVASIYVHAGTQITCTTNGTSWWVYYDATGWHASQGSMTCVNGLD